MHDSWQYHPTSLTPAAYPRQAVLYYTVYLFFWTFHAHRTSDDHNVIFDLALTSSSATTLTRCTFCGTSFSVPGAARAMPRSSFSSGRLTLKR